MIKRSQKLSHDIYIEVYKHYRELALNEDRLLNERLMVFLTGHSILFLGFIMCFQVQYYIFHIIGIFLSVVGIILCVFGYLLLKPAWKTWEKWQDVLTDIENKLKKKLTIKEKVDLVFPSEIRKPQKTSGNITKKYEEGRVTRSESKFSKNGYFCSEEWPWRIGCWGLPLTFLLLWIVSFVCSLHIVVSAMFFL
jgi:hypothetical protein